MIDDGAMSHSPRAPCATLFVWFSTGPVEQPPQHPDKDGGHVGLLIESESDSAYLGWWPEYYRADEHRPSLSRSPLARLLRFLRRCRGHRTACATKPEQRGALGVNDIDSVLVPGQKIPGTTSFDGWPQREPDVEYCWKLKDQDASAGIQHIHNLDPARSYHALFRNCATLCVAALRTAGIALPRRPIWSPYKLWKVCEADGHLGATRRTSL